MTTDERSRSTESDPVHAPVLVGEVVAHLAPRPDGVYVDCTVGLGGHTAALLAAGAGRVIGIDRDTAALAHARARFGADTARVDLVHADYRDLAAVLRRCGVEHLSGAVADLGISSMQVDDPGPRLQLQTRRSARHADGSIGRRDARRPAAGHHRVGPRGRHLPIRRRAPFPPRGARDRRRARRRHAPDHRRSRRRRPACGRRRALAASRSGDPHVSSASHLGERRDRRPRRVYRHGHSGTASRGAGWP